MRSRNATTSVINGQNCTGNTEETKPCSNAECPGKVGWFSFNFHSF